MWSLALIVFVPITMLGVATAIIDYWAWNVKKADEKAKAATAGTATTFKG